MTSRHKGDVNGLNENSSSQSQLPIRGDASEKQDTVATAGEPTSLVCTEREETEEKPTEQDLREQGKRGVTAEDKAR